MKRDDSILYTGASSASFSSNKSKQIEDQREKLQEQKKELRGKLKPAAEIVFAEIQAEMRSVMFVENIDIESAKDERLFMVEMMARKKYVKYLKQLQNKLDNILREPKSTLKAKPEEDDDED